MAKKKSDPSKLHLNQANFKSREFFQLLTEGLVNLGNMKFGSLAHSVLTMSKHKDAPQKAFYLISTALGEACRKILTEDEAHQGMLDVQLSLANDATILREEIVEKLIELDLSIDVSFFAAPHRTDFIHEIKALFQIWLKEQIGFTEAQSKSFSARLPGHFLVCLIEIWNNDPSYFKEVKTFFNNPFFQALVKEKKFHKYYTQIQSGFVQPVLGSPKMTLADIYIEPNFKVYKKCSKKDIASYKLDKDGFYWPDYKPSSLHHYMMALFQNETPLALPAEKSDFMLLLGQPGQGKTSFCLRTIYDLITEERLDNQRLFFVRLRHISNVKDLINNPLEVICQHIDKEAFKTGQAIPLKDLESAILVLDGLDEIYMHQGLTNNDINNIVSSLSKELANFPKLKIILTSRYNYLDIDKLSGEKLLIVKLAVMNLKQQLDWLGNYKAIYPDNSLNKNILETINSSKDKKYQSIKELINQPILLQLIAESGLNVSEGSNRAKIYEKLFDNIIERKWSRDGQLEKYENLEDELRAFLQTIALVIYQSDFEYVRRYEFKANNLLEDATKRYRKKTNNQLDLNDTLKDILVSFYFKNVKKHDKDSNDEDRHQQYAIEFMHKSLQEYLAAEYIWIFFKDTFLEKKRNGDYFIDNWKEALRSISPITAPKMLSQEVTQYLIEVIQNDSNVADKKELTKRLIYFLPDLLKKNFLYQYDATQNVDYPFNRGLANFYSYWTILSHIKKEEDKVEGLQGDFLSLLKNLIIIYPNRFVNLTGADLMGANLIGGDLIGINLRKVNLSETDLRRANLVGANLRKANLVGAYLERADLDGVDLKEADLRRANLKGANLMGADLRRANLKGANLKGADLRETDLREADLRETGLEKTDLRYTHLRSTYLVGAYLVGADLVGADLVGADLSEVDLREADLSDAILREADLSDADLREADLREIDLNNAILREADLREADLREADLRGANLNEADLRGANLRGANLRGANLRRAKNLKLEQLLQVHSLKGYKGLPTKLEEELKKQKPELFE